jgi:hypothetical protein
MSLSLDKIFDRTMNLFVVFIMVILFNSCHKIEPSCADSEFSVSLDNNDWPGEVIDCAASSGTAAGYNLSIWEITSKKIMPDILNIRHFSLERFKIYFTENNSDSMPQVIFYVIVGDQLLDRYKVIPDSSSWLELESIDLVSGEVIMNFDFTLASTRPNGALNNDYGDTILFTNGFVRTQLVQ